MRWSCDVALVNRPAGREKLIAGGYRGSSVGTAVPVTAIPPSTGISTARTLGRPTCRPWWMVIRRGVAAGSSFAQVTAGRRRCGPGRGILDDVSHRKQIFELRRCCRREGMQDRHRARPPLRVHQSSHCGWIEGELVEGRLITKYDNRVRVAGVREHCGIPRVERRRIDADEPEQCCQYSMIDRRDRWFDAGEGRGGRSVLVGRRVDGYRSDRNVKVPSPSRSVRAMAVAIVA